MKQIRFEAFSSGKSVHCVGAAASGRRHFAHALSRKVLPGGNERLNATSAPSHSFRRRVRDRHEPVSGQPGIGRSPGRAHVGRVASGGAHRAALANAAVEVPLRTVKVWKGGPSQCVESRLASLVESGFHGGLDGTHLRERGQQSVVAVGAHVCCVRETEKKRNRFVGMRGGRGFPRASSFFGLALGLLFFL